MVKVAPVMRCAIVAMVGTALVQSAPASAGIISLGVSANNSVQIQALSISSQTVYEIQLGGGSNQPPSNTFVTGAASTVVGATTYSGYYKLATVPSAQLRMVNTIIGPTPGSNDRYDFLVGHNMLMFTFAPTNTFSTPWLVADITNVYATQEVQTNGNAHPPIFVIGTMGAPTGGSLAGSFPGGDSELRLNIGGNQRLLDLLPTNSFSGLRVEGGQLVPAPSSLLLLTTGLCFGCRRRRVPRA